MTFYPTFIMEQHLGHQTLYQNLRRFVDNDPRVRATWAPVTYTGGNALWERFPFLPARIRGSLTGRQQARQGLRIAPCDVVYFNTQVPAVLCNPQATKRPYVIATDITPVQYDQMAVPYGHRPDSNGVIQHWKHRANCRVLRGAARLLPWSDWAADSLVNDYGVDAGRVEVMPVGVDLEWWRPGWHSPGVPAKILFVGGDFARKGGNLLIEAFRHLPKGCAELVVVTQSDVPQEDGVRVYRNMQPNSVELRTLYQNSDFFVLPSTAEAFGISAVEASAMGLPVIATRTGGLANIVVDQQTGFLVPVGDVQALTSRLQFFVENVSQRQEMGRAAYRRAQMDFDARKNAARLIDILTELSFGGKH